MLTRLLAPRASYPSLDQVPLGWLRQEGYRGILLDVDETLVSKYGTVPSAPVIEWLAKARRLNFSLYIVSNTFFPRRMCEIAKTLAIPYVERACKPFPFGFWRALRGLGLSRQEVVMVGDQLFTDMLGANLLGIYSIYVAPFSVERTLTKRLMRSLEVRMISPPISKNV